MESSEEPTSLQSICHLRASELFPKSTSYECEDATLAVPFALLSGEYVVALGHTSDGVLALSNYRLYVQVGERSHNVPLGLIELLEVKEIFYLHISCKDARSISCAFSTNEHCLEWFKRLHKITLPRKSIEDMFAFAYYAWSMEERKEYPKLGKDNDTYLATFNSEVERLKFNLHGTWRISQINKDYQLCPSYPPQILVPACISDKTLETVAKFRTSRRIPAVIWRHVGNGAVIARSSQPEVGWLGWRSTEDEDLLKALTDACFYDRGESTIMSDATVVATTPTTTPTTINNYSSPELSDEPVVPAPVKKVLIVDARSYTTAVANRARGGGCECPEYYANCEIQFMNLPNIHSIRKSFHAVRQLCASDADQNNWLSLLEGTKWFQHMSGLLRTAVTVASAIEREERPVLVHCSDGWDRTTQIVALAQLLLDPYYRTMEGFQVLCEREWLDFGHKFADRCGHNVGYEDPNERCPVFLQWLDCVYQLTTQFKCSFQMSPAYLVKLAQHAYSQLFGTFLCNTRQERLQLRIRDRTFSIWRFLNSPSFVNHLYTPTKKVLWPSCNVRDLKLWHDVYLGSKDSTPGIGDIKQRVNLIDIENGDSESQLTETRSYGDLIQVQEHTAYLPRRQSDPSISIEKKFDTITLEGGRAKLGKENGDELVELKQQPNETNSITEQLPKETEEVKILPNVKQISIEANTSVASSTDTIVPNGDLIVAKNIDQDKDLCCGKIFCADCSENSTPLPSEQLYNPVRVCSECYTHLHHHTSPCQCRQQHHLQQLETQPPQEHKPCQPQQTLAQHQYPQQKLESQPQQQQPQPQQQQQQQQPPPPPPPPLPKPNSNNSIESVDVAVPAPPVPPPFPPANDCHRSAANGRTFNDECCEAIIFCKEKNIIIHHYYQTAIQEKQSASRELHGPLQQLQREYLELLLGLGLPVAGQRLAHQSPEHWRNS
ncbi:unnamed protein product [Trichogramma brassicae]|uniref:phosphatidylinositol-3,5-bisphosphate 3-phosphatase n=1 Tax=Trichogramma brassicae TaxID=86971 RepID=A0A6H5I2I8_9HYME|nr:unnamed protein product [Trichogramma brassicae]